MFLTINPVNDFLAKNSWWIAIVFVVAIVLLVAAIFMFKKNKKASDSASNYTTDEFVEMMGGLDNIVKIDINDVTLVTLKSVRISRYKKLPKDIFKDVVVADNVCRFVTDFDLSKILVTDK